MRPTAITPDSTISFGDLASTMMMCHKEGLTDYEINTALGAVKYYSWTVEGFQLLSLFYDETRREVMKLMHQNFQFLNGTWRVTRIGEKAVDVPDMKMVFDVDEGKVHGNTGCNIFNGNLEIDMEKANSISISALGVTRMGMSRPELRDPLPRGSRRSVGCKAGLVD